MEEAVRLSRSGDNGSRNRRCICTGACLHDERSWQPFLRSVQDGAGSQIK